MPPANVPSLQTLCAQSLLTQASRDPALITEQELFAHAATETNAPIKGRTADAKTYPPALKSATLSLLLSHISQVQDTATPAEQANLNTLRFRLYEARWSATAHPDSRLVRAVKGLAPPPSKTAAYFIETIQAAHSAPPHTAMRASLRAPGIWPLGAKHSAKSQSRQIKQAIAQKLWQLSQTRSSQTTPDTSPLDKLSFNALKQTLLTTVTQHRPVADQHVTPQAKYRLDTYIDLATRLLYIDLHGTDATLTDTSANYQDTHFVTNAFKGYLDKRLAANEPAQEAIAFLSNVTLTGTHTGAPVAACLTPDLLSQAAAQPPRRAAMVPGHRGAVPSRQYANIGKQYGPMARIKTCSQWLHTMLAAKRDYESMTETGAASTHEQTIDPADFKATFSARIKHNIIAALNPNTGEKATALQADMDFILDSFCDQVKQLFPALNEQDVYRAKTNVWAIFVLQRLFQGKFEITPAALGYSALYPLTDSLIDDPNVDKKIKKIFFEKFHE